MNRMYGGFSPKRGKRGKNVWAVKGKRGSLIKFPKGGVICCKVMQRWENSSLLIIITTLFLCQLLKDYIGINLSILT